MKKPGVSYLCSVEADLEVLRLGQDGECCQPVVIKVGVIQRERL